MMWDWRITLRFGELIALGFAALTVLAITVLLTVLLVRDRAKRRSEAQLLRDKIAYEQASEKAMEAAFQKIRKLRHDMRNHLAVLQGLLEKGNIPACQRYVSALSGQIGDIGSLIHSGNPVVDYLINTKLTGLGDVQVLVSGYVGNYADIESEDLASMLGNLLDNAVEAQELVSGVKRIELHFLCRGQNRIILCKNTVEKSVLKSNRQLRSTKEGPGVHGLGHQIMETVAARYNGWIDYFEEDGMFGVQIVLPDVRLPESKA